MYPLLSLIGCKVNEKRIVCVCQKRFSWFYNNRKLQELGKDIDPEHSKYASLKG